MQAFAPVMTIKTERRKKARNRPRSLVYVELESANGGMMRDLSEEGFALRAMMPLQASAKTQFAFSLDGKKRISGEGRIAWVKEDGRVAGIEFCGLPQSAREEIRGWLARIDLPGREEHKPAAFGDSDASTMEELRMEAHRSLAHVAAPKAEPVEVAPHREPEIAATPVAKVNRAEERREEVHSSPPQAAVSTTKPVEITPAREPEILPIPEARVSRPEVHLEEVHSSLPRMAMPTIRPVEAKPEVVAEKSSIAVPETPAHEEQEEKRFTLPRVSLASVGSAARTELVETPAEIVAEPSVEVQRELPTVPEKMVVEEELEPLPVESRLEPLPELEVESEFSEKIEEPLWKHFTLGRAIGIMVLLTLMAGAVVGHRQVGHALVWLGQMIAGDEETAPAHTSTSEPAVPTSPAANTTSQVPVTARPVSSAAPEAAAASGSMEGRPTTPALSPAVTKTPSTPALQPAMQQSREPGTVSTSEADTEGGLQEYREATWILKDKKREGEIPEAVRLLWAAVEKGNVRAEMTLAEMYQRGQGVAKSCDQARILWSAAVQKGSGEAQKQLEALAREGCE